MTLASASAAASASIVRLPQIYWDIFLSLFLIWTLVRQLFISNSVRRRLRNDRWWGVYEHGQAFCISHAHCGVSMGASTAAVVGCCVSLPPPAPPCVGIRFVSGSAYLWQSLDGRRRETVSIRYARRQMKSKTLENHANPNWTEGVCNRHTLSQSALRTLYNQISISMCKGFSWVSPDEAESTVNWWQWLLFPLESNAYLPIYLHPYPFPFLRIIGFHNLV